MANDIPFLSGEGIRILLFLIPGYVMLQFGLIFFRRFFPAFRYRSPRSLSALDQLIASIICSSFVYLAMFPAVSIVQIVENQGFSQMFASTIVGVIMALGFVCFLWFIFTVIGFLITLGRFLLGRQRRRDESFWKKGRWNRLTKRVIIVPRWDDDIYILLLYSITKHQTVTLHLFDGRKITGKLRGNRDNALDGNVLKLTAGRDTHMVRLYDVQFVTTSMK
jgi:hypothetical protein